MDYTMGEDPQTPWDPFLAGRQPQVVTWSSLKDLHGKPVKGKVTPNKNNFLLGFLPKFFLFALDFASCQAN